LYKKEILMNQTVRDGKLQLLESMVTAEKRGNDAVLPSTEV